MFTIHESPCIKNFLFCIQYEMKNTRYGFLTEVVPKIRIF